VFIRPFVARPRTRYTDGLRALSDEVKNLRPACPLREGTIDRAREIEDPTIDIQMMATTSRLTLLQTYAVE
jgi:hypothetical protein